MIKCDNFHCQYCSIKFGCRYFNLVIGKNIRLEAVWGGEKDSNSEQAELTCRSFKRKIK